MKSFIVLALLVCAAAAAPPAVPQIRSQEALARIVSQVLDNIGVEGFKFGFETENNIKAEEQGAIQDVGTENEGLEVVGRYSYVGDDGVLYEVVYKAGRNGFEPQAAHIPKGPVVA